MAAPEKLISDISDTQFSDEYPVDMAHLSVLTMDDRGLQQEVLGLFVAQIPEYLKQVKNCREKEDVLRTAHTIKGAARSIGAHRLANLAKHFESVAKINILELEDEFRSIEGFVRELSR